MSELSRPVGRPSKYDPVFCDQVIETLGQGHSLAGFAGKIGVARSTINEWIQAHAEFSEACARAKAACAFVWEERANQVAKTGGGPGTASVLQFALRNFAAEDWSADKRARVSLPSVDSAAGAMAAIEASIKAFAAGEIDREHAEAIVAMSGRYIGAVEMVEIEARLAALEAARK